MSVMTVNRGNQNTNGYEVNGLHTNFLNAEQSQVRCLQNMLQLLVRMSVPSCVSGSVILSLMVGREYNCISLKLESQIGEIHLLLHFEDS